MLGIFSHYRDQRLKQVILRFITIQVDQFKAGGSGLDGYFRGCSERRLSALFATTCEYLKRWHRVIRGHIGNLPTVKINRTECSIFHWTFVLIRASLSLPRRSLLDASLPPPELRACLSTWRGIVLRLEPGGKNNS